MISNAIVGICLAAPAGRHQQHGNTIEGYSNIIVVRQRSPKLAELVTSPKQFMDQSWRNSLDKTFVTMEGDHGLLVVAERSALEGPKDRLLSRLIEFGGIDSSGTIIVGKEHKELASSLAAVSPFNDSRSLLSAGTYRIQIKPQIQVGYKGQDGNPALSIFSPAMSPGNLDGLSTIAEPKSDEPPQPIKAKDLVFEEYYRQPYGGTEMLQAQKLIGKMADANHESLLRMLFARCSIDFGRGISDITELSKKVHDFKDLPFDFKSMLANQHAIFSDKGKGLPDQGAITGIYMGVEVQLLFKGSDGNGKRQIFGITQ